MKRQVCQGIVPPYVVRAIGDSAPDSAALTGRQLELDETIRRRRAAPGPGGPRADGPAASPAPQRTIHDAGQGVDLPGKQVRSEGAPAVDDVAVNEAYDGLGATFAFYWDVFGRNSIDGNGLPLLGTVHYDQDYDNAFWDGAQMIFGDGDRRFFNRFTVSVDVIGHELTHGVTGAERNLDYEGQSGALNESLSDVFGSMVKQYLVGESAEAADWLIGEGLFTSRVQGVALRSMKAPGTAYDDPVLGKDPQPAQMSDYVKTDDDNGGVHINSGIPNRAFCLAATAFGGSAWEKAGPIWYAAMRDASLPSSATFQQFAAVTVAQAGTLYDAAAAEVVAQSWGTVGVTV
jgi:Zn-dependent metalloprotease